jgi:hypothetical protein
VLRALQRALIYYPGPTRAPAAATVLPGARDAVLETSDGLRLGAWLVAPAAPALGATVLVANGNAGDRSARAPLAYTLARRGLQVLLFDYRGYSGNRGRPSESGLARDVRAARRFLLEEAGVPGDRLLYFGESLGAAVVAELATEHPPAALALRSPFADLASVGRVHYPFLPVGTLLLDRYPVAEHVARVNVPTVVVYGTDDRIVPPEQSLAVAAAAAGPARVVAVEGADHNDPELCDGPPLIAAVAALADDLAG